MKNKKPFSNEQILNYYQKINAVDKITKDIGMSKDYRTEFKNVLVEYDKWFYSIYYYKINAMSEVFSRIGITTQQTSATIVADVLKVTKPITDKTRQNLIKIYK